MTKKNSKLDKMNLLKRALKHLGLRLKWRDGFGFLDGKAGFIVVDGNGSLYMWYKVSRYVDINYKISRLEDFLSAKWFEHYSTIKHKIIENPFFGLSPEELAIKVDLLSGEKA